MNYATKCAEYIEEYYIDLTMCCLRLEHIRMDEDEIRKAVSRAAREDDTKEIIVCRRINKALNFIYNHTQTMIGKYYIHHLHNHLIGIEEESGNKNFVEELDTFSDDIRRILDIDNHVNRATTLFGYILLNNLYEEMNASLAFLMANAILINSGWGFIFAKQYKLEYFAGVVDGFIEGKDIEVFKTILRNLCLHKIPQEV